MLFFTERRNSEKDAVQSSVEEFLNTGSVSLMCDHSKSSVSAEVLVQSCDLRKKEF